MDYFLQLCQPHHRLLCILRFRPQILQQTMLCYTLSKQKQNPQPSLTLNIKHETSSSIQHFNSMNSLLLNFLNSVQTICNTQYLHNQYVGSNRERETKTKTKTKTKTYKVAHEMLSRKSDQHILDALMAEKTSVNFVSIKLLINRQSRRGVMNTRSRLSKMIQKYNHLKRGCQVVRDVMTGVQQQMMSKI